MAIPTETVYGLAGHIYSQVGLQKIFSVKERPFFDPLIVHVSDIEKARALSSNWTIVHEILAQAHWPGPLTLIAQKHPDIDPLITSGLESVGLRCPDHPVSLDLLSLIKGGLAAPSANKFGKTSPTSPQHVFDEFGDEVAILDGGVSQIGIESTVVGVHEVSPGKFKVEIYRPGHFTASMLQKTLSDHGLDFEVVYAQSPVAPGQLKHHYMPRIPLVIVPPDFSWENNRAYIETELNQKFTHPVRWEQPLDPRIASRELYQRLRNFDQQGYDVILAVRSSQHSTEEWKGIWNRLEKAQSLTI